MNVSQKDYDPDKIRQAILEAAMARFSVYGYNKTTMAEIARDCDMSAANLYRFFQNKLDIGVNLASCCLNDAVGLLQAVVDQANVPASDRLRQFVMSNFEYIHSQWSQQPRMNELVTAICHEKMDLVDAHMEHKQVLLQTLITQGIESGEFETCDPAKTAEAILSATTLFYIPLLMPMYNHDSFLCKANAVVDLVLQGVLKR